MKVAAAGLCHSDLHLMEWPEGTFPWRLPFTLGHETAGTVAALGRGASGFARGRPGRSSTAPGAAAHAGNACAAPRTCARTVRAPGRGLRARLRRRPRRVHRSFPRPRLLVPIGDLDPVAAAPLTDAALTPYHAIKPELPRLVPGSAVVVIGVGGLGHLAVQLLRALSPARIVAVDLASVRARARASRRRRGCARRDTVSRLPTCVREPTATPCSCSTSSAATRRSPRGVGARDRAGTSASSASEEGRFPARSRPFPSTRLSVARAGARCPSCTRSSRSHGRDRCRWKWSGSGSTGDRRLLQAARRRDRCQGRGRTVSGRALEGRVAVVTGGGSGIGEAICVRLAADGARVAVLDVSREAAELTATLVGGAAVVADVADAASVDDALAAGRRRPRAGRRLGQQRRHRSGRAARSGSPTEAPASSRRPLRAR